MFSSLFHSIMLLANQGVSRFEFLREGSSKILEYSGCEMIELHIKENNRYYYCEFNKRDKSSFHYRTRQKVSDGKNILFYNQGNSVVEQQYVNFIQGMEGNISGNTTDKGSFWSGKIKEFTNVHSDPKNKLEINNFRKIEIYNSAALLPFEVDHKKKGLLELWSEKRDYFTEEKIRFLEDAARMLGFALSYRNAQVEWRERVKELTCLYEISKIITRTEITLDKILKDIVKLLPPAWLYPNAAEARIVLDKKYYSTPSFRKTSQIQSADIFVNGKRRGAVEVAYIEEMPENDIGPFLNEESELINTVAKEIGYIIEQKSKDEERANLQEKLNHADRLALIGQLVAGVAHELNEPVSSILGFAQLVKKNPGLSKQSEKDIDKIVNASLYIREIIKQLLTFAREAPYKRKTFNLNEILKDSLHFFESRCVKEGIELKLSLSAELPEISADMSQMTQVLLNLIYNAMHAMPHGGKLTLSTVASDRDVIMIVEDTGIGISKEMKKQIFLPFFTTKDAGQGTGLGLSVVHGIVTSHGGSITVNSRPGKGSRFEVRIPVIRKK